MKKLKKNYKIFKYIFAVFLFFLHSQLAIANQIKFEIKGNNFTDPDTILSLLKDIPDDLDNTFSNEILKVLNDSNLFSDVIVKFENNKYIITVEEYPNINNLYFENNERLKDEDLEKLATDINLSNLNISNVNLYINEIKKIYLSFGYNNVKVEYSEKINKLNNTVDLYFKIFEGKITKINQITINGNTNFSADDIKEIIKSKTKTIRNIFANNNYKPTIVERDEYNIINFYKNKGFLNVLVDTKIEYLKSNRVNIYFTIKEGEKYLLSSIKFEDKKNILNSNTLELINKEINNFINLENAFSVIEIRSLKNDLSSLILNSGFEFFEIKTFDNVENTNVKIIFQIHPIIPKYTNQINIVGNYRTLDYVIRRELEIIEGDAIYETQIQNIKDKLSSLNLFQSINIKEEILDDNNINLIIEVEEKQTGTFNAGVSVGTLDGFAIVTGLRENNFYGTGRSLDFLVNTSEDKNQFKLITTDRLSYENEADISYSLNYKQQDLSKASSYKLDTFSSGIGIGYKLNKRLYHNIDIEYSLKDYQVTDSANVSSSISSSSGGNMSYLLKNNLRYSSLNPGFIAKNGQYINFNNIIESPTSSNNGFVRNLFTYKQYYNLNGKNIFSFQTKLGNIFSLNNNDILSDDKFSLGGRWLRGFDSYGAGPRNSRTSYVGGNNILATKLDYSYELNNNSNFPIYFNLFNDYGFLWDNKTKPTHSDNNLRSSAGFGIRYYSPIGPIGFTWGFPIADEEYDIKRMFLFSIGNID